MRGLADSICEARRQKANRRAVPMPSLQMILTATLQFTLSPASGG